MWTSRIVAAHVIAIAAAMVLATEEQIIAQALNFDERPFVWDAERGMRNLETVLIEDFSLDLTGWVLTRATGVSADGSAIIGLGSNPQGHREGWIARLGETSATFQGLGDLPGGDFWTDPLGISGDGNVVVGRVASSVGTEAFRWTEDTGLETLGFLPEATSSVARAISTDGRFIVGGSNGPTAATAFRWSEDEGMIELGHLPEAVLISQATAVSSDGSVVVGQARSANIPPEQLISIEAFRWTQDDGMVGLGDLPTGMFSSRAHAVSGDGSIIVGRGAVEREIGFPRSGDVWARWVDGAGPDDLGILIADAISSGSAAWATSQDGSVIVGEIRSRAVRWTAEEGLSILGPFPGQSGVGGAALDVTPDGSFIVGFAIIPEPSTLALLGGGAIALLSRSWRG